MWFWWFILLCDLLIPVIMFVGGLVMVKHCPRQINGLLGYRTARSMVNMDTWKFAHTYCGKIWWKAGAILSVLTAGVHLPFYHSGEDVLGILSMVVMFLQLAVLLLSLIPTERALKKTFHDDGSRR